MDIGRDLLHAVKRIAFIYASQMVVSFSLCRVMLKICRAMSSPLLIFILLSEIV